MMKFFEMLLWCVGTILLALYFGASYWAEQARRDGVASFAEVQQLRAVEPLRDVRAADVVLAGLPSLAPAEAGALAPPDTRAHGHAAIRYASADGAPDTVIAVLRIPGIELEVPVYHGTTEQVLRRGAGLVEGTAFPGSMGNVGIAAHRDSHFRGLKDVAVGDLVELVTSGRTHVYRIDTLQVVGPGDVHVLDDTGEPALTLVTCYPFYFAGNAPQRYIVRATAADGFTW